MFFAESKKGGRTLRAGRAASPVAASALCPGIELQRGSEANRVSFFAFGKKHGR